MFTALTNDVFAVVAPLAGAWIEISITGFIFNSSFVAPLAGAWIEILSAVIQYCRLPVAPLAGAWIEIRPEQEITCTARSLPLRERGLKSAVAAPLSPAVGRSPCGSVD